MAAPGSSTAATAATTPAVAGRPCDLLTSDEVARAFGAAQAPAGRPLGGSGWIEAQCEWTLPNATVSIAQGSSASLAAKGVTVPLAQYVADRRTAEEKQFATADLTGAGDGGYLLVGRAPTALVYKGAVLLQLIAFSPSGAVAVDVATSLATLAVGRVAG